MLVIRKTTNNIPKKRGRLFTATLLLLLALAEQPSEQLASQSPIFAVDAVLHLGSLHLTLYQARILQFLEVLRYGGLGYGQFIVDVAKVALRLLGQKLQDGNAGRVPHCFGKARCLLLLYAIILTGHTHFLRLLFANIRTCFELVKNCASKK